MLKGALNIGSRGVGEFGSIGGVELTMFSKQSWIMKGIKQCKKFRVSVHRPLRNMLQNNKKFPKPRDGIEI